jgi:AraC-like DNA-binding protein
MSIIEAAVRGGAFALLGLLTVLLLRDARSVRAGRYAALFTLGAACDLIGSAPAFDGVHALWLAPMRILGSGGSAVFWITVAALFDDGFEASWPHVGAWVALVGLGVFSAFAPVPWRILPHHGLALICIGLALWNVLAGRSDDLDDSRRRLRLIFAGAVGAFIAGTMALGVGAGGLGATSVASAADAAGNLALAFFFAVALLSLTPGAMLRPLALVAATRPPTDAQPIADPRDGPLLEALRRELEANRAYREEQLGIAALAARLGAPEYRLRRLINQQLGHRNFAAFLNGYRIEEAMAALADPGQTEVPILTIALDTGFASIGPFNRAFKARTGQTPSEYRRAQLAETLRG